MGYFVNLEVFAADAMRLAERAGGRVIIGIVGPPGAGKSTFAEALSERIGDQACVVPMDGFHLAQLTLEHLNIADRKGCPETFDVHGYASLLRRIREELSSTVYAPDFRRSLEEPIAGAIAVSPTASVVLTEGNFLLLENDGWGEISALLDEVWYLELPDQLRRERLVDRHRMFGKSEIEAREWVDDVDEANAILVDLSKHRATRILTLS
jgi:pantothenate kinase